MATISASSSRTPAISPVMRSRRSTAAGSCRNQRRGRLAVLVTGPDERPGGLRHLVPHAREVPQRLGDDEAGVVAQPVENVQVRVQRADLVDVMGEVQRTGG